jgi:putative oxidoreductase
MAGSLFYRVGGCRDTIRHRLRNRGQGMFHVDHSIVTLAAHALVAVLFIGAGVINAFSETRTRLHAEHFAALGLPAPWLVLFVGYALQFSGGSMVLFDWHADVGALMLIVFTVAAMLAYHNFWTMKDSARRNTARLFFLNNCAVLGGLVLIAEPALPRVGL